MNVAVRQRARDDGVVVVGISLRFHQRHAAARGTSLEVGVLRGPFVEGLDDRLRFQGHLMRRAIREIDHLLGMTDRPVAARLLVAGVGARRRVPAPQRVGHFVRPALNGSGKAAISGAQEFSVPVLQRQPELHVDQGVGRRLERHLHAAVGRNVRRRRTASRGRRATGSCAARSARRRRPLGDDRRRCDDGIGELEGRQRVARRQGRGEKKGAADHGLPSRTD